MAGGDLAGGKTLQAATGAFICFEDEAGVTGRPPKGRTWTRRGITPRVKVSGRSRGRLSEAGLLCYRPGLPARLCFRHRLDQLPHLLEHRFAVAGLLVLAGRPQERDAMPITFLVEPCSGSWPSGPV